MTDEQKPGTPPETSPTPGTTPPPVDAPPPSSPPPTQAPEPQGGPKRDVQDLTSTEHDLIESTLRQALIDQGTDEALIGRDLILSADEANGAFRKSAEKLGLTLSGKDSDQNATVGVLVSGLEHYYAAQKDAPVAAASTKPATEPAQSGR